MAQNLVVALLVAGCLVYVLWTLAPKAPRSRLASKLLTLPLPKLMQKPFIAAVRQQGGCGSCGTCAGNAASKKLQPHSASDKATNASAVVTAPLVFFPRAAGKAVAQRT